MTTRPGILITGGAKRVGAALSRHFAKHEYDIALHYNQSKAEADGVQKEIEALGAKCVLVEHDMRDIVGIPAFMERVKNAMPDCTALINNASVFERATLMDTDEALFDRQFDVNFKAPFFLTQSFAKTFGKGCVVNMLDTDISKTQGSHFAYLLSKKTLAEFTMMAARELGPDIRVNGVCPGYLLSASAADEAYEQKMETLIPMKSHPTLEDVANCAHWLMAQPYITGQLIFVDGGKHVL